MFQSNVHTPFAWLASSILDRAKAEVASIEVLTPAIWRIHRHALPPFTLGVMRVPTVTIYEVNTLFMQGISLDMIVNAAKESHWEGEAILHIEGQGIAWGGVGDVYRACRDESVRDWRNRTRKFVENALRPHSAVASVIPINEKIYLVNRYEYRPLRVIMIYEYTMLAEHVRHARATYGEFDEILNTNPYGSATEGAKEAAKSLGAAIFSIRNLMGRLGSP